MSFITIVSVISISSICAETPVALRIAASEASSTGSWNWLAARFTATGRWIPCSCQRRARSQTFCSVQ